MLVAADLAARYAAFAAIATGVNVGPQYISSGSRLTKESALGFPTWRAFASLGHAHWNFPHGLLVQAPSS